MIKRLIAAIAAALLLGLTIGPAMTAHADTQQSTATFVIEGTTTPEDPDPGPSPGPGLGPVDTSTGSLGMTSQIPPSGSSHQGLLPAMGSTAGILLVVGLALLSTLSGLALGRTLSRREVNAYD